MARITLKHDGACKECGASLKAGDLANYYGRGKVYGIGCHEYDPDKVAAKRAEAFARQRESIIRAFCEDAGLDYDVLAERVAAVEADRCSGPVPEFDPTPSYAPAVVQEHRASFLSRD